MSNRSACIFSLRRVGGEAETSGLTRISHQVSVQRDWGAEIGQV